MVWSTLSDQKVIQEILESLDDRSRSRLDQQMHIPEISSWKDLVAVLLDVDFLVASRLHSAILGFIALRPTVAISFDPKVDWVMEDLGQTDSLLQIRDFEAEDVIRALDRLESRRQQVTDQIRSYRQRVLSEFAMSMMRLPASQERFIHTPIEGIAVREHCNCNRGFRYSHARNLFSGSNFQSVGAP